MYLKFDIYNTYQYIYEIDFYAPWSVIKGWIFKVKLLDLELYLDFRDSVQVEVGIWIFCSKLVQRYWMPYAAVAILLCIVDDVGM